MGIKERQERDREAVSRAILDAARELFVAEGYQNVSIRKIAERIEYSPAPIYGNFPCSDDLFFALAEEGFRLFGDPADPAVSGHLHTLEPLDRLREIFWRVYQLGLKHPHFFWLRFIGRDAPPFSREYERFSFVRAMKAHMVAQIQTC